MIARLRDQLEQRRHRALPDPDTLALAHYEPGDLVAHRGVTHAVGTAQRGAQRPRTACGWAVTERYSWRTTVTADPDDDCAAECRPIIRARRADVAAQLDAARLEREAARAVTRAHEDDDDQGDAGEPPTPPPWPGAEPIRVADQAAPIGYADDEGVTPADGLTLLQRVELDNVRAQLGLEPADWTAATVDVPQGDAGGSWAREPDPSEITTDPAGRWAPRPNATCTAAAGATVCGRTLIGGTCPEHPEAMPDDA